MDPFESFQSNRITDRLHAIVQVVIVFLILGAANYIGMRTFKRVDLTEGSHYTLSLETKAYLKNLEHPIQTIVTISETDDDPGLVDVFKDIKQLLREYEYATRSQGENRITVEYLNVYSQASRAAELEIQKPNVIVFKSGQLTPVTVNISDLYTLKDLELREFLGENVFTRSILKIAATSESVIYVTTGHGEFNASDVNPATGASEFFNELQARNLETRSIDLTTVNKIPDNAALVIIAAPKIRFTPEEQMLLSSYLDQQAGRVLTLLEPSLKHGLEDLFSEWGLLADDVIIAEQDPDFVINGGDLMIRLFDPEHPITGPLFQQQFRIITDRASSVREDLGRPIDDSLIVTELFASSSNSWGERDYKAQTQPTYDPSTDLAAPVKLAAIAERKVDSSLGISLPGGKLIVIGTSNFISNHRIQSSGNLYLMLNAINFALDKTSHLNIPPRPIRKVKLDLSLEQLHLARYMIWFGPPLVIGLLGFLVYLSRRN